MIFVKRLVNKLSLCYKSIQNRIKRHSLEGTKSQIKNIENTVNKYPRLYSKKREGIFNEAVKNRIINN